MKNLIRRSVSGLAIILVSHLVAARPAWAESGRLTLTTGLVASYFARSVTWEGDDAPSRITGPALAVRQDFRVRDGLTVSLSAGWSMSGLDDLVFRGLPVSLEYGSGSMHGLAVGAEVRARLAKTGEFEIKGVGQIASSFGLERAWTLEGFAVPGEARGRLNWTEVSAGPEISYLAFGAFVPSLEVLARWLWVDFKMDQTLGDLTGAETKRVKADLAFIVSLGGEYALSERLALSARVGIMPNAGGVDGTASAGFRYRF
ncbi:MAG: hypothetical protein FJY79_07720 [Candidatus Aminicenantes bacterium]|nr:hypothetical protein [Candidatus Aminicenantes bacterium]